MLFTCAGMLFTQVVKHSTVVLQCGSVRINKEVYQTLGARLLDFQGGG